MTNLYTGVVHVTFYHINRTLPCHQRATSERYAKLTKCTRLLLWGGMVWSWLGITNWLGGLEENRKADRARAKVRAPLQLGPVHGPIHTTHTKFWVVQFPWRYFLIFVFAVVNFFPLDHQQPGYLGSSAVMSHRSK